PAGALPAASGRRGRGPARVLGLVDRGVDLLLEDVRHAAQDAHLELTPDSACGGGSNHRMNRRMDQLSGGDPAMGFELVAASIRADASDLKTFLDVLAVKLEQALPGMVFIEREGGLFKRERKVQVIRIQIEDKLYDLARAGGGLEARLSHQVRGITLKNEVL